MMQGIVFDCDGTLAHTMPLHWEAWQTVTRRHGLIFPEDRFYSLGGVPSREILKMCIDLGGAISGEHGVGLEKRDFMPLLFAAADLELMNRVRLVFNPRGLCNPGKVFPNGRGCGELGRHLAAEGAWI